MTNWQHPTGNQPKAVALICLGPSRNTYINACLAQDLSEAVCGLDEVWTLNRGIGVFRHDLGFVMDHIQGEADKYPRYGALLWKHDKPIITSDNCAGWPDHVHKLPIREMWRWVSSSINPMHGDWYHNSVAYILLYAAFIGVRDLRVFGADYSMHSSGTVEDGHPNVAYWVGKLEATGLVVTTCADSSFLNANQRDHIYGYQRDPRTIPANRARFRAMVGLEPDEDSTALLSAERQVAADISAIQPDHVYRYQWAASKVRGDRVLDLGSGCGYGSALLADAGARQVNGFDLSAESVAYAREHHARPAVIWETADLDGKPIGAEADSATAFEIIEHLADPKPLLNRLRVKRLFASVPNERVVPYSPETAPFHQRHYTQEQLKELLRDCGWLVAEWRGQDGPNSSVGPLEKTSRTLIVEAVRKQ
jgi:SAM-dependent methyltransferase